MNAKIYHDSFKLLPGGRRKKEVDQELILVELRRDFSFGWFEDDLLKRDNSRLFGTMTNCKANIYPSDVAVEAIWTPTVVTTYQPTNADTVYNAPSLVKFGLYK